MATTIEEFVKERGIQNLVHFSRIENLDSILENGLVTLDVLNFDKFFGDGDFISNDSQRLDFTNAVCASITLPNYKIFKPKRDASPGSNWVVLEIDPSVMWETRCAFCVTNAASSFVTALKIEERMGLPALQKMFATEVFGNHRSKLGISDRCTTDPQAEVLLRDGAHRRKIKSVYFLSTPPIAKSIYESMYPNIKFIIGSLSHPYFKYRADYQFWR